MKNSKLLKQSQRKFALGLILGILVAFFLALLPREKDTKITLIGGLPPYGEVWLTGIEINGAQSNLDDYPLGGKWKKIEESIVYVPDAAADGDELELIFHNAEAVKLTFNKHTWSGGLGIQDGADFTQYDLYAQTGQETYLVKNVQQPEWSRWECILSVILLLMIAFCLETARKKHSISFKRNWLYVALGAMVFAIAFGSLESIAYSVLWTLLIYVLLRQGKKVSYGWLWLCVLASYMYRIYFFLQSIFAGRSNRIYLFIVPVLFEPSGFRKRENMESLYCYDGGTASWRLYCGESQQY